MRCCIIVLFFFLSGCTTVNQSTPVRYRNIPRYPLDPKPERILLLNTYDVNLTKYRNNKKELFSKFIDSVLVVCKAEIEARESIPTKVIAGVTNIYTLTDDTIYTLMNEHHATHAIVMTSFNVDFDQTNVKVEKSTDGSKSREAFYDIISTIHFMFYSGHALFKEFEMKKSACHSSRSVVSGLLAAGPNVVVQRKDAWNITRANLEDYLNLFFNN